MSKQRERGLKSRAEILDAALRIMSQRGYAGTSISAIGAETGLPNSSIYWHFASKSAILAAVMERGAERFFEDAIAVDAPGQTPRERLSASFRAASASLARHEEFLRLRILLLLTNDDPHVGGVVQRVFDQGRRRVHEVLHAAYQDAGDGIATRISDELTDFTLAAFDGIFLTAQFDPQVDQQEAVDLLADAVVSLASEVTSR